MHQVVTLPKASSSVMQPRFRTGRVQRPGTVNWFEFTFPEHRLLLIGRPKIEYRMLRMACSDTTSIVEMVNA